LLRPIEDETMPDILGDLIRRVDVLEAAVCGRASTFFDRKLFKSELALREGRATKTIERGVLAGSFPPPDGVTNGKAWWWLSTLERNDRAHAGAIAGLQVPRGRFAKKLTTPGAGEAANG
jgi:hypothetical protein